MSFTVEPKVGVGQTRCFFAEVGSRNSTLFQRDKFIMPLTHQLDLKHIHNGLACCEACHILCHYVDVTQGASWWIRVFGQYANQWLTCG